MLLNICIPVITFSTYSLVTMHVQLRCNTASHGKVIHLARVKHIIQAKTFHQWMNNGRLFGILENYHCCHVVDFTTLVWCRVSKLKDKFCSAPGKVVNVLSCFFLFVFFENTEMRPSTLCVLPRRDSSPLRKRCLSSCADFRWQKASCIFQSYAF